MRAKRSVFLLTVCSLLQKFYTLVSGVVVDSFKGLVPKVVGEEQ